MRSRFGVGIAAWGLLVFSSAERVSADSSAAPMHENWDFRGANTSQHICPVVSENLARAMAASLAPGAQGAARFSTALKRFTASPTAVAEARAAHSYAVARHMRTLSWASVYLATFIRSEEAVGFLRDVAIEPSRVALSERSDLHADSPAWSNFQAQLAAVEGIAKAYASAQESAHEAVLDVVSQSERELCRMLGLELYVRDRLTAEFREIIESRGVSTHFRSLTATEHAALALGNPSTQRAPDKASRQSAPAPVPSQGGN